MAWEQPGFSIGVFPADADLSGNQYSAVKLVAAGATTGYGEGGAAVELPSASGEASLGIVQNNPQLGEAAAVMVHGVSKAIAGETISIGNLLMSLPSGKLGVATSSKYAIAQALEDAVNNDTFTVLLIRNGKQ